LSEIDKVGYVVNIEEGKDFVLIPKTEKFEDLLNFTEFMPEKSG
jgi:hypothetical protein